MAGDPFGRGGSSGSGGGSSDPFGRGGGSGTAPKKGSGGILGALAGAGHFVASKAGLAAHDIKAIPGGFEDVGKLLEQGTVAALTGNQKALNKNAAQIKALGRGQLQSASTALQHPARDPFQTATVLLPLLHGAGNVAARAGAASDAARAGGGASDIAKALATKPAVAPRFLDLGDSGGKVPLHPSKTVTGRAFQGLYDKVLQKAVDTNPEGRIASHATRRAGASLDETARYQQRMRETPAGALDQAAKKLTSKTSRAQGRVNQAALELTSVNTSPEDAAAYHLGQAAKGVEPARNRVVAKLYQTVADKGLLGKNEHGDVIVNAAEHPQLAHADLALAKVQGRGDEILARYGIRSPEALQKAANAPGQYRAGGAYETIPARQGRVEQVREYPARSRTIERMMTPFEAQTRLGELDKQHASLIQKLIPETSQYGGDLSRREQLNRNFKAGKSGIKPTTVKQEEANLAEERLRQVIARNPEHPGAKRAAALLAEREQLRQQLNAQGEASLEGRPAPPLPTVSEVIPGKPRRVQLKAIEPQNGGGRIVGGESARPARGHVSYASSEKNAPQSPAAASTGPVVGEARSPLSSHANTGFNIEHGLVPKDITGGASRHFRQIIRFVNTTERRNAAIRAGGTDVSRSKRDVLVRVPGEDHAKISRAIEEALGKSKPTVDEIHGLDAALDAFREDLVPGLADRFSSDAEHPVGTSAADAAAARGLDAPGGYKFVDRNLLGDLGRARPGPRGRVARTADNINSAVTAATVYFKIGHVGTRVLTNAATNIIQGSAKPADIARSVRLWDKLGHEDRLRALAAAGQHGFASMPHEGTSRVSRVAGAGAAWWARHADAAFRFNSIAYEARKAGYDTPAEFTKLLDQLERPASELPPAEAAKVQGVAKNANREGIAYDRLNNFERQYVTRGVWFYPWVKGASVFAGRTLFEHPVKAGVLGAAGVHGREVQQAELGDLPSYEGGLFKVGGADPFGRPLVADFSTFSPFATPADILDVLAGKGKGADFLNPALAGAGSLAYKLTPYGQSSTSPITDSLKTTLGPAWPVQLAEAYLQRHEDQSKRMFPKNEALGGTRDTLLRALLGPGTPRRINLAAAASAAAREKTGR